MNTIEELLASYRIPDDAEGRGNPSAGIGVLTPLLEKLHAYYQGVAVLDGALVLSAVAQQLPKNPDVLSATIQVQGGPIRYNFAGGPLTAATGFRADVGTILRIGTIQALQTAQFLLETATAATLAFTYWS